MNKKQVILLIIILSLSFMLRVHQINHEDINKDEGLSIYSASKENIIEVIKTSNKIEATPPVYFIILHYWMDLFGSNIPTLRLLSVIFDILAGIIIFLLAKNHFGVKIGFISLLIHSFATLNILYSQEIRMYTLFSFLAILSTFYFLKLLQEPKKSNYFFYFITSIFLLYTHYFGIFMVLLQYYCYIIFHFKQKNSQFKPINFVMISLSIISLPNLFFFINKVSEVFDDVFATLIDKYNFPSMISSYSSLFMILLALSSLSILFIFTRYIIKKDLNIKTLKTEKLIIPVIIFISLSFFIISYLFPKSIFFTRYPIFLFPFVYIFMAKLISSIKSKHLKLFILLFVLISSFFSTLHFYSVQTKPSWNNISFLIENTSNYDDPIFIQRGSTMLSLMYYLDPNYKIIDISNARDYYSEDYLLLSDDFNPKKLDPFIKSKFWLITAKPHSRSRVYLEYFEQNYQLISEKKYAYVNLYLFINKEPNANKLIEN